MLILHGAQIKRDQRLSDQEFHFEQAGHDDCSFEASMGIREDEDG